MAASWQPAPNSVTNVEEVIDGACLTTDFDEIMPVDKLHFELIILNQLWGETDRRDRGELG